jgi:hypothetical protein
LGQRSSKPLLLSFRSPAFGVSVCKRFCLALYLVSEPLLFGFGSFAFFVSIRRRFCLAPYLVSEPLLFGFCTR